LCHVFHEETYINWPFAMVETSCVTAVSDG
jgi:hypothetical protein